ncbi:hypothetical protein BD324DRAFT_627598 [Kockovaella imperatae]|uniref:Uncharacterized protein n=1 Tax=Kockovaella imperatae TaxID=4999 RepID=A0A1Y1UHE1_9TREE|nr:hypothetical protein BD324DRAFT_627598 [Kockovaella imperatae]ORX36894.1 hypothetical protein BD324DRAFT_627598 [Kockovaella imperatae]
MAQVEDEHGAQVTQPGPPVSAPVASQPSKSASQINLGGVAIVSPNDGKQPGKHDTARAIPTNPSTSPAEAKQAAKKSHPAVVAREVEKTKAEQRELKGKPPKGTVVAGLEDDRLWAMLRRFDVQITHVLHPASDLPSSEPDLRPSTLPNLPSHSEMLKSNLERVIAAIGPSSVRGAREIQRLCDWGPQERVRTASYCATYFIAWAFGYAVMSISVFLVVLVCFPHTRRWLFPPIPPPPFTPPSATDPTNKKGDESLIGNVDNKAVHRSKAEQAEEQAFEAAAIVQAYTAKLIFDGRKKGKAAGNSEVGEKEVYSDSESSDSGSEEIVNKPTEEGAQGVESAAVVVGGEQVVPKTEMSEKEKKKLAQREAKRKRDEMVSKMTKATENALGSIADTMERLTNALSPPGPYPDRYARFKIAAAFLVPPGLILTFVPAWIFGRAVTFMLGAGLWGQPIFKWSADKFVHLVPNWRDYLVLLDIRNSILSGVPTDQQLTLHLLRVAEALQTPLPRPPPPPLKGTPKEAIKETTPASMDPEEEAVLLEADKDSGMKPAEKAKVKTKSHIITAFQKAGKKLAGFHGDVSVDGAKKQIGTTIDKYLFRGLVKDNKTLASYPAKLEGDSGHIILEGVSETLKSPQISFVPLTGSKPKFVLPVDDIVEMKKSHVSMPRIALGWASGADVEGLGLTLRFKDVQQQIIEAQGGEKAEGKTLHFTRVGRREQLFVRLISMGRQRWETL